MQNIRCLTSLDEKYRLHGSGSIQAGIKEASVPPPPPPLTMSEMGGDGRLPNRTIINITLLPKNIYSASNVVRVI